MRPNTQHAAITSRPLLRRHQSSTSGDINAHTLMVPFSGIGTCFCTRACACQNAACLHQGVFICGARPLWLIAHRGAYRAHALDTNEPATEGPGITAAAISAMTPWHDARSPHGFIVVNAGNSELQFSQLPPHVRAFQHNILQFVWLVWSMILLHCRYHRMS